MSCRRARFVALLPSCFTALLLCGACSRPPGGGETAVARSALAPAPSSVSQFVLLASGHAAVLDRTVVAGGNVGAAGTGDSVTAASDARLAISQAVVGQRVVLGDRAAAGALFTNQVVGPNATFGAVAPFSPPPPLPPVGVVSPGSAAVTVASGQSATLAAGKYGRVAVTGTLRLTGGLYQLQELSLSNGATVLAAARATVRIARGLSTGDRARIIPATGLHAADLRIIVAGPTGVVLGNDVQMTALVVASGAFGAGDRLVANGAAGARDINLGHDGRFTFDSGFGCSTAAGCDDGNACTVDACVDAACVHGAASDGTHCSDGNVCTQQDSCRSGTCTAGGAVDCSSNASCVCNPATASTVKRFSLVVPSGADLRRLALSASGSVAVGSAARVLAPAGTLVDLASAGPAVLSVGANARVGNLWSQGGVSLGAGAVVNGFITTAGTVTGASGATVAGAVSQGASLSPSVALSWLVAFPPGGADVNVAPSSPLRLAPGVYGNLQVPAGATVRLTTGTYVFTSLRAAPQSVVVVDTVGGPIFMYVATDLVWQGTEQVVGDARRFLAGAPGTAPISLLAPFAGTLVAPNATVRLAATASGAGHRGAFFARNVSLDANQTVTLAPFAEWDMLRAGLSVAFAPADGEDLILADQLPCEAGLTLCGDACANLTTDPAHCGSCDRFCGGGGCAAGLCTGMVLASGVVANNLAQSSTDIFFSAPDAVSRVSKSGGAAATVDLAGPLRNFGGVTADDQAIFWTATRFPADDSGPLASDLLRAQTAGGAGIVVRTNQRDTSNFVPAIAAPRLAGDHFYFLVVTGPGNFEIHRAPTANPSGGVEETVASSVFDGSVIFTPRPFAVDGVNVYFPGRGAAPGATNALAAAVGGGGATPAALVTIDPGRVLWGMESDTSFLYYGDMPSGVRFPQGARIQRVPVAGGGAPPQLVAALDETIDQIAVDATDVFVLSAHAAPQGPTCLSAHISKIPKAGGAPVVLTEVAGKCGLDMVLDDANVYWTTRDEIRRLKKDGTVGVVAPRGAACVLDSDCDSGHCADGVCCDTACGGGATSDCQACSVAAGAAQNGTCGASTGNSCSDGNACTGGDVCQAGACTASPVVCAPPPDACYDPALACDASLGQCAYAFNDGAGCSTAPDLDAYLDAHPTIANAMRWQFRQTSPCCDDSDDFDDVRAWPAWTAAEKDELRRGFHAAWHWAFAAGSPLDDLREYIKDPPLNLEDPALLADDKQFIETRISAAAARQLYVATVAQSLLVEIGGLVPWSITGYDDTELSMLLSSGPMMRASADGTYRLGEYGGENGVIVVAAAAAPPRFMYAFLRKNGVIGTSRLETIGNTLQWARVNMEHFILNDVNGVADATWQYRGNVPISRVIQGTNNPLDINSADTFAHWTAGCPGTVGFLSAVLRTVNIPVRKVRQCFHTQAYFPTENLFLEHGDDPYDQRFKARPDIPAVNLLIDPATYLSFFGTDGLTVEENVGNCPNTMDEQVVLLIGAAP